MKRENYRGFEFAYYQGQLNILKDNMLVKRIECTSFHNGKTEAKTHVDELIKRGCV